MAYRVLLPKEMQSVRDVKSSEVWSSGIVGPNAKGLLRLFCSPLGQEIPRLGQVPVRLFPTHVPLTTSLFKAGELGSAIGDMAVTGIRADFIGGTPLADISALLDSASFELKVAGKRQASGGLRDLPLQIDVPVFVERHDTLTFDIDVSKYGGKEPILVRVVLSGKTVSDVR